MDKEDEEDVEDKEDEDGTEDGVDDSSDYVTNLQTKPFTCMNTSPTGSTISLDLSA